MDMSLLIYALQRAEIRGCRAESGDETWTTYPPSPALDDPSLITLRLGPQAAHDLAERLLRTVPLNGPS